MTSGKGGVGDVALGLVVAAIAVPMYYANDAKSAINYSEETEGQARHIGRAVVVAASIGVALEVGTFLLVFFGISDVAKFVASTTPLLDAAKNSFGTTL